MLWAGPSRSSYWPLSTAQKKMYTAMPTSSRAAGIIT
jgi:hypothetical protein